jgi:5-methylcytosine-specific restriction protein A
VLREEPNCRLQLPGCTIRSTHADHIVNIAEGGAELDRDNLQGLCSNCHRKKTGAEGKRAQRRRKSP